MSLGWLFLDLNSYFASVEQAEDPRLRGKPIAVVPMMAENTSCLAASYPAKKFGVKTGTKVKDARKMCPGIIFIEGTHRKYIQYHNRIVEVVEKCIPVTKVMSVDEMACQLMGREKNESNARDIASKIKQSIASEISPALTCSIGIAPNRYLAKVASDMEKPDGLTVIKMSDIPKIFYRLTPRDFPGIGPNMEQRFFDNHCSTVERMYNLSIAEMRKIWGGIKGEEFWKLIRGEDLADKDTKNRSISHSQVLAPKLRNYKDAYATSIKLLSKACMRMRDEKYYAREINLEVKFMENDQNDRYWHGKSRFMETQDTCIMCEELEKMWLDVPRNRKFLKVSISFSNLIKAGNHQLSFFENQKRESLMGAWDNLNAKYAKSLIYVASSHPVNNYSSARIAFQHIPKEHE
jgi:DNA polymerase-4